MDATTNELWQGYQPEVKVEPGNPEAAKYGRMWERPEYRIVAPGETFAQVFLGQAKPRAGASIIDFGCGTGRGGLMLAVLGQMNVTMVDFVRNCLDEDIWPMLETQSHALRFVKEDLEKPLSVVAEYGFCTDVMEHIPPDKVDIVLDNILKAAQHVFFSIAMSEDKCGELIGENLHLSVHDFAWWLNKFNERDCVIHWSQQMDGNGYGYAQFYLTAWQDGQALVDAGILNCDIDKIKENVIYNCAQGWQQVMPHETNDNDVMILGGGPSLEGFLYDIKQKRAEGVKCITLNGTYNWAVHHGLNPSAQIIVDARPFNARFVDPVVDGCKYLIASQCDPSVLAGLPKDRTYLWHTTTELIRDVLNGAYETWWAVPGGSTVLLRAIPLLRMLGFKRFHLYGCDSCIMEDRHHAYSQPENDSNAVFPVTLGGKIFYCQPFMASQCREMFDLIKFMGNEMELEIHGDGLLAWSLEYGARLADEAEFLK